MTSMRSENSALVSSDVRKPTGTMPPSTAAPKLMHQVVLPVLRRVLDAVPDQLGADVGQHRPELAVLLVGALRLQELDDHHGRRAVDPRMQLRAHLVRDDEGPPAHAAALRARASARAALHSSMPASVRA